MPTAFGFRGLGAWEGSTLHDPFPTPSPKGFIMNVVLVTYTPLPSHFKFRELTEVKEVEVAPERGEDG